MHCEINGICVIMLHNLNVIAFAGYLWLWSICCRIVMSSCSGLILFLIENSMKLISALLLGRLISYFSNLKNINHWIIEITERWLKHLLNYQILAIITPYNHDRCTNTNSNICRPHQCRSKTFISSYVAFSDGSVNA